VIGRRLFVPVSRRSASGKSRARKDFVDAKTGGGALAWLLAGGTQHMTVRFFPNDKGNPPGKLADAELHFSGGPLDGLKLIGFGIWERKNGGRNVTFPARQYSVNGERRSFALLRPIVDATGQDRLRDLILEAYKDYEQALAEAV
jgi:hypothetical protein